MNPPQACEQPTLAAVVAALEAVYPPEHAQSWDQVGLVTGDPDQPVRHLLLAVDPTLAVIEQARDRGADLIVTHHPLLMRGLHSVATTSAKGASITALIRAGLGLYVAHTNADVASPGVNDALAQAAGLEHTVPLADREGQGLGRVGSLPEPLPLAVFAARLARQLPPAPVGLRVSGDPDALVQRIAVLGGAGDDAFAEVRRSGAQVYVTADLRHHPALEAREEARGGPPYLIDAGHWATEWLWLDSARQRIRDQLGPWAATVQIEVSSLRTDPWDFLVATDNDTPTHPVAATAASNIHGGPR